MYFAQKQSAGKWLNGFFCWRVWGRKCYYMQANKKLKASWAPFSIENFLSKEKKKVRKKYLLFFKTELCVKKL
jgi:hypothetical protein